MKTFIGVLGWDDTQSASRTNGLLLPSPGITLGGVHNRVGDDQREIRLVVGVGEFLGIKCQGTAMDVRLSVFPIVDPSKKLPA